MPNPDPSQEFWCVCRKYCKGHRRQLNTANTWRRHVREASEDEKDAIRMAGLSDEFQTFVNAASGSNNSKIRANSESRRDDSEHSDVDSHSPPGKRRRQVRLSYCYSYMMY
jgi:hypothetical protein